MSFCGIIVVAKLLLANCIDSEKAVGRLSFFVGILGIMVLIAYARTGSTLSLGAEKCSSSVRNENLRV